MAPTVLQQRRRIGRPGEDNTRNDCQAEVTVHRPSIAMRAWRLPPGARAGKIINRRQTGSPMSSLFVRNLAEHSDVLTTLAALEDQVQAAAAMLSSSLRSGGKVLFCGNGGSAADSQHLASELTGRLVHDRRPLAAIALTTDTSALTCIANDYSFEAVFARQVLGLGRPGDCLVAISTSGQSANVLAAVHAARSIGVLTVGLLGHDGGQLRQSVDCAIVVASSTTARIQEMHILIGHTLCGLVEESLGL